MTPSGAPQIEEFAMTVQVTAGRIGVRHWPCGDHATGQAPLVLLHGFTGSSESWRPLAPRLALRRDVLAIDLFGHGASELDLGGSKRGFETFAWALDQSLEALAVERCSLAGYSLGGRVALHYALFDQLRTQASGRASRVCALALESASPGLEHESERRARREADEDLAAAVLREGIAPFMDRWEQTPVLRSQLDLPEHVRAELRRIRESCKPEGLAGSLRSHGLGVMPWLGPRLAELRVPVLVLAGANDAKFAAIAARMSSAVPRATCRIVEGAGHALHLEAPEAFLDSIETHLSAVHDTAATREVRQ